MPLSVLFHAAPGVPSLEVDTPATLPERSLSLVHAHASQTGRHHRGRFRRHSPGRANPVCVMPTWYSIDRANHHLFPAVALRGWLLPALSTSRRYPRLAVTHYRAAAPHVRRGLWIKSCPSIVRRVWCGCGLAIAGAVRRPHRVAPGCAALVFCGPDARVGTVRAQAQDCPADAVHLRERDAAFGI